MNSTLLAQMESHIAEQLRDYGQYLSMRESGKSLAQVGSGRTEQRFGIPEVGLAVGSIIAWLFAKYIGAMLDEFGKQHARILQPDDSTKNAIKKLEKIQARLDEANQGKISITIVVQETVISLKALETAKLKKEFVVNREAMIAELTKHGLTRRAATAVTQKLAPILEDDLKRLFEEKNG